MAKAALLVTAAVSLLPWHVAWAEEAATCGGGLACGQETFGGTTTGSNLLMVGKVIHQFMEGETGQEMHELPARLGFEALRSLRQDNPKPTLGDLDKRISKLEGSSKLSKQGAILTGVGTILGKVVDGESVSAIDIAEQVGLPMIAMVNPMLGVAATFVFTFFKGLFGKKSEEPSLFTKIMEETEKLIDKKMLSAKMKGIKSEILDTMEELEWIPGMLTVPEGTEEEKKLFGHTNLMYYIQLQHELAVMKRKVFHEVCFEVLDEKVSEEEEKPCKDWQEAGTVMLAQTFATLHITVLVEIMRLEPIYTSSILARIDDVGNKYDRLLLGSASAFERYRLGKITPVKYSKTSDCNCPGGCHGGDDEDDDYNSGGEGLLQERKETRVNATALTGKVCCKSDGGGKDDYLGGKNILSYKDLDWVSGNDCDTRTRAATAKVQEHKESVLKILKENIHDPFRKFRTTIDDVTDKCGDACAEAVKIREEEFNARIGAIDWSRAAQGRNGDGAPIVSGSGPTPPPTEPSYRAADGSIVGGSIAGGRYVSPTVTPTPSPTVSPTVSPTFSPTVSPTVEPTLQPIDWSGATQGRNGGGEPIASRRRRSGGGRPRYRL